MVAAGEALRLHGEGRPAEALPSARQALAQAEQRFGRDDAGIAPFLQLLAEVLRAAGRADEAVPVVERALALNERAFGAASLEAAGSLNALGTLHLAQGDAARALPLLQRALALREAAPGAPFVAASLSNLASAYDELGRPLEALPLHRRAVALRERDPGPEDPRTATAINNLAETLGTLGRFAQALPLHERALAIREKALGPDHPDTAVSVNNLAELLDTLGQAQRALALKQRAVQANLARLGPAHPSTLGAQGNLAYQLSELGRHEEALALATQVDETVRKSAGAEAPAAAGSALRLAYLHQQRGDYALALPLVQRALAQRERQRGATHPDTAVALNNLAELHAAMGEYGAAFAAHRRVLAIREAAFGPQHPEVAGALNNLGSLHVALGEFDQGRALLERALAIHEAQFGAAHPQTAMGLNNLAHLALARRRPGEALPLLERARAMLEPTLGEEHAQTTVVLNNLAVALEDLGRTGEALALQRTVLARRERAYGAQHASVAVSLNNLAALLHATGRVPEALPLFRRALSIVQAADAAAPQPVALAAVHSRLALALESAGRIEAAIFHLKLAVNQSQRLRAGAATLERAARESLATLMQRRYRTLAQWLVREGRLAEAEQVLALLKLDERRDLVRGDSADASAAALAALAPAERELAEQLNANAGRLSRAYAEMEALGAAESPRRAQLVAQIQSEAEALDALLADTAGALARPVRAVDGARPAAGPIDAAIDERDAIAARLAELNERGGARAAALHIVPGEKTTTFLLVTAQGAVGQVGGLGEAQLNALVAELRQQVQAKSPDYRRSAAALHAALIAPVAPLLERARIDTLMLYLTGTLRYAPVAALWDAQANQHLVQRYALAVYTVGGLREALAEPPRPRWAAAGLGVSRALAGFEALPAVAEELRSVIRGGASEGVLGGSRYLDEAFTRERLGALASRTNRAFAVMHVATHFKLVPGREDESHLLLGDGDLLSLRQLRSDPTLAFASYDLVTLSACNTSMGGGPGGRMTERAGAEFEGLATTLMRKGARAVMATLWEVQDSSTAALMRAFYAARGEERRASKAAALREAQLALAAGGLRDPAGRLDFTHPYYWSGFVLMGNWL